MRIILTTHITKLTSLYFVGEITEEHFAASVAALPRQRQPANTLIEELTLTLADKLIPEITGKSEYLDPLNPSIATALGATTLFQALLALPIFPEKLIHWITSQCYYLPTEHGVVIGDDWELDAALRLHLETNKSFHQAFAGLTILQDIPREALLAVTTYHDYVISYNHGNLPNVAKRGRGKRYKKVYDLVLSKPNGTRTNGAIEIRVILHSDIPLNGITSPLKIEKISGLYYETKEIKK